MHVTTAGELRYPWLPPIADLCTQRQPALVKLGTGQKVWGGGGWVGAFGIVVYKKHIAHPLPSAQKWLTHP